MGECGATLGAGAIDGYRLNPSHRTGGRELCLRLKTGAQYTDGGGIDSSEMVQRDARLGAHPDAL
jgi:hypothetical protein